jgi:hypothetical protein
MNREFQPITDRTDIARDVTTGAILSRDKTKLMEAKRIKKENERYINLENRIEQLEKLVQTLLKGNNK